MWLGVGWGRVGFWPDTKSGGGGGGGGCCRFMTRYEKRGRWGGGGCCRFRAQNEERGRWRGGGGGGGYDRVSGGPGYSTVVEFMRTDINRQRNRAKNAARIYKWRGGGVTCPECPSPLDPPLFSTLRRIKTYLRSYMTQE